MTPNLERRKRAGEAWETVPVSSSGGSQTLADVLANGADANGVGITNLPDGVNPQDAATVAQLGGSQPFVPTDLTGLALWLDASDEATINAGSPSDGDPVSAWADKSASGYDAAQATADNKPIYKTAVQNGFGVVRFDGSSFDQFVALSGAGLDLLRAVDGCTVAIALLNMPFTNSQFPFFASANGDDTVGRLTLQWDGDGLAVIFGSNDEGVTPDGITITTTTGNRHAQAAVVYAMDYIMLAGAIEAANLSGAGGGDINISPGATPNTASDAIRIGFSTDGSAVGNFTGDIGELIVYQRALNAAERRELREYLSTKWSLL